MRKMIIPLLLACFTLACSDDDNGNGNGGTKDTGVPPADKTVKPADKAVVTDKAIVTDKAATKFSLSSPTISEGKEIPGKFTCDGKDISPELTWTAPPAGTKSIALIMDDPDAPSGTWVHWVVYGIKPTVKGLPEDVKKATEVAGLCLQGTNDFNKPGYGGPCPPPGPAHNYKFKLYALSVEITLKGGATKADLEAAMKGKILAQSTLTAKYLRPKK